MFLGREVSRQQDYSEETARRIDAEVARLLREAHERAVRILEENREKLEMVAQRLLELETIDGRDVKDIVELGRVRTPEERDAIDREKEAQEKAKAPPVKDEAESPAATETIANSPEGKQEEDACTGSAEKRE